ncbi:MAG: S-layer homology domain-containing protein [Clostridia bacterium]|nr:S-layer homology domain-containing protein [Clostridia bacterium]
MKKLISLLCIVTLLATSIVTFNMPKQVSAAQNAVSYDFEGFVGNDETLALAPLTSWGGKWGYNQFASGLAGITDVQTDRGTSVNLIDKDTTGALNYTCLRPTLASKVSTSMKIKVSINPIELNRARAIRIHNNFTAFLINGSALSLMGKGLSMKSKANTWYDIDITVNFVTGYYVASLTLDGTTETVEGVNNDVKKFATNPTDFIEIMYFGKSSSTSNMYIDDVYVGEASPFYKTILSEGNFDDFAGDPDGITTPDGFSTTGVSAGVNGFYPDGGKLRVVTGNTTPLTLEKEIPAPGSLSKAVYGTIGAVADVNISDTEADRSFIVGTKEVLKFSSDGTVSAGDKSATFETGVDYKVSLKIDTVNNKVTASVFDDDVEFINGTTDIAASDLTKVIYKTTQTGSASESFIDNFSFYSNNGFYLTEANPADGSKNIKASDVTVTFTNPIDSVGYVTLNGKNVDYQNTESNRLFIATASEMEYGKDYTLNLGGVKNIFGEEKDFELSYSTIVAKSISNVSIEGGETVTAKVTGVSNDGADYNYAIVLAQFNAENNMLQNIDVKEFTLEEASKTFTASLPYADNSYYEAYLWDSFDSMNAICEKATLGTDPLTDIEPAKDGLYEDMDTGVMIGSGLGTKADGSSVLVVLKQGKSLADLESAESITDVIDFIKQYDNNESDIVAFTPTNGNGLYDYVLDGTLVEDAFDYIDPAYITSVYEEINKDSVSFVECINEYNKILSVDTTEFENFTDDEKAEIDEIMLAIRSEREDGFDTIASFQDAYYKAAATVLVKYSDDIADVKAAFEKYGESYGIDKLSAYKTYTESNDTAKAEVYAIIANASTEDKDTFEEVDAIFGEAMILAAVRNSTKQTQIGNIINDNNDTILNFDFSKYNKVTNKSALHTMLIGSYVNTIAEFEAAFNKAVEDRLGFEATEEDVSEGVAASGNYISYDFEGWVGNDETLALSTLQDFYGTNNWFSYQLATGKAGPTSVKTDRGTSMDVVQRDAAETNNNAVVRPYSKSPITTTAEIKVSVQFKEMNRSAALYIYGNGGGQYNTFLQEGTNGTLMGTRLSNKLAPDTWYDLVYRINKVSGYYEVTISCDDWSETVVGRNTALAAFPNFNYLGLGYIGKRNSGTETHIWYDDISWKEIDPLYIPMLDENDFDTFESADTGVTAPKDFEASGVVSGKNGFFAEDGKINIKTAQEGDLTLSKKFEFETGYDASVYGILRTDIDITPKDKNADRKIMIGDIEIARFGANGRVSAITAYQNYDVNKEYKVTVLANSFVMQRELGNGEMFKFNNVGVIVKQGDTVVLEAIGGIPTGRLTDVKLVVSQVKGASETLIDNFNMYNDNGFYISKATPAAYETNVVPCDAVVEFSNTITDIESITVNDEAFTDYEFVDSKTIKLNFASDLEYNKRYTINFIGVTDMFGETKDFKHTFYTTLASNLSEIAISDGEKVTASVNGFSYDGNKYNYVLVLAKFDSTTNKLIGLEKTNITLGATKKEFTASIDATEGAYYEAYVWDALKTGVAIKNKVTLGTNALADPEAKNDGYYQDMDTGVLTATNTGVATQGSNTLLILKPGKKMNDIIAVDNLMDVIDYIGQFDNISKDVYAFTPSAGGKYGVAINGVFTSNVFEYIDASVVANVLAELNKDDADFTSCIGLYNNVLRVDTTDFDKLTDNDKARLNELIDEEKSKNETGFDTIADFGVAFKYAMARVIMQSADTANEVKLALEKYGVELGIEDFVAYSDYAKLSDQGKSKIYADIAATEDLSTLEKIEDAFATATILRAVQYASNHVEIKNIITNNNDYLDFDLTTYNKLDKPVKVNSALIGNYYSTISKLESAFTKAVSEQKKAESSNNGGSSGSGGSSGGSYDSLVTLGPVVPESKPVGFTDLAGYDWAKEAISELSSQNIISGRSSTIFDPGASITREEFTKIVINAFTSIDPSVTCDFKDVSSDAWYYSYVATANKIGIINGTSKSTFGTGEKITRQDMAAILYRTAEIFGIELEGGALGFADSASVSDYAKDAVAALSASGIVNGKGNNCFEPFAFATRAEAAKMIYETMERGDK